MTLNGVMAIILRYFAEFGSFHGQLRKSGWLAINRFSPEKCHKVHQLNTTEALWSAVLFAVAELLVCFDMNGKPNREIDKNILAAVQAWCWYELGLSKLLYFVHKLWFYLCCIRLFLSVWIAGYYVPLQWRSFVTRCYPFVCSTLRACDSRIESRKKEKFDETDPT